MYQESERYIYNEMMFNQTTPRFNKIQDLVTKFEAHFGKGENVQGRALQFIALGLWGTSVASGSVWDHKPNLRNKFGLSGENADDLHFKIPGEGSELFYDVWSNIHYGSIGRAAGFTGGALHAGAEADFGGAVGRTDPGDILTVQAGVDMYDKYGADMTYKEFQTGIQGVIGQLSESPDLQYRSTEPNLGRWPHSPYY
ncbi:polymorphic toxin type 44 domain-containing protein [Streptomyces sp. NPDC056930]|uniref:polymorphic toxin type 44 domain-containing protein n=1 Tax=Streptomyces sp. NPDC056930 TaxID=3345967 RepID=UPI00363B5DD2